MSTTYASIAMARCRCAACAIVYMVPEKWQQERRDSHATFYCPNGHSQWYPGKSEAEKLRDQLAREKHFREQADAHATKLEGQLATSRRQASAARGQVTKIKNRVAKGVCPCCNRTFKDLARHMAGKHPDYTVESEGGAR